MKKILLSLLFLIWGSAVYAENPENLTIGLMSELTGPGAANGKACREGYEAARLIADQTGTQQKSIRLIFGDHRGESRAAMAEYNRMRSAEKAQVIISNRGHIGMVLDPLSKRDKVPLLGIMGHAKFLEQNPYGFRYWVPIEHDGKTLAQVTKGKGLSRVAIIALHDDYILAFVKAFRKSFEQLGGSVVYEDTIEKGLTDFSTMISRIKASKPDVIFVNGSVAQLGVMIRKIREQGLKQQLISNFWAGYGDVIDTAGGPQIEGLIFTSLNLNRPKFLKALREVSSDSIPSAVTYACYAALASVYDVVSRGLLPEDGEEFFYRLIDSKHLKLVDETIEMRDRQVYFDLIPYTIRSGKPVPLSEEQANQGPIR